MFKFSFLGRNKRRRKGSGKKYPDWYKEAHGLNSASSSLIWLMRVNHKYGSGFYGLDFDLKKTWTWYPEKRQLNWFQYWNVCEKDGLMSDNRFIQVVSGFCSLTGSTGACFSNCCFHFDSFRLFPWFQPFFWLRRWFLNNNFSQTTIFMGAHTSRPNIKL